MKNSQFSKHHNLLDLFNESGIKDEKIKNVVQKYAFSHLFLASEKKCDTDNQFERYPQGFSYDKLEMLSVRNSKGKEMTIPANMNFYEFLDWMGKNNAKIASVVTQEKITELIEDIEFFSKRIRRIALNLLQ